MYHSESTHHPWINHALRSAMFRFARLHLQPDEEAEDAVQDALFALVEHPEKITHAADVKHYLFGILKNKITDCNPPIKKFQTKVENSHKLTQGELL